MSGIVLPATILRTGINRCILPYRRYPLEVHPIAAALWCEGYPVAIADMGIRTLSVFPAKSIHGPVVEFPAQSEDMIDEYRTSTAARIFMDAAAAG